MSKDLPDCPHPGCDAAQTLEVVYQEMGVRFVVCSCCGKSSRVTHNGEAHPTRPDVRDISGALMDRGD